MRLTTKVTLSMAFLVLLTTLGAGALTYAEVESALLPRLLSRLSNQVDELANEVQHYVSGVRADLLTLARGPMLKPVREAAAPEEASKALQSAESKGDLEELFASLMSNHPEYLQIRLIGVPEKGRELVRVEQGPDGNPLSLTGEQLQEKGQRDYYKQSLGLKPGDVYVSPIELNREQGQVQTPTVPVLRVSTLLHDATGRQRAVLIINLDLRPLFDRIRQARWQSEMLFVLNEHGDYLIHPDRSQEFAFEQGPRSTWRHDFASLGTLLENPSTNAQFARVSDEEVAASVASIKLLDKREIFLVGAIPTKELLAPVYATQWSCLVAASFALPLAILIAIVLARSITRPLVAITQAVESYARNENAPIPTDLDGEIGVLAKSFDSMRSELAQRAETAEKLNQQLRESQKMEAIGRLAGGIAHDFNNLLTVILGCSELALEDLDDKAPCRTEIKEIQRAGERASSLTSQLLAFSRRQILKPRLLNLNEIVQNAGTMLSRLIGEDIDLIVSLDRSIDQVEFDPVQIEQIIINLVVNARDAMPKGGKLTLETANVYLDEVYASTHPDATAGPHVMLAVTDTGVGMDEETRSRIFEPFFTTKAEGAGTGLGLSTVYGIVKQSGGNVFVYSELNTGTVFKVYLPRAEGTIEDQPKDVNDEIVSGGDESILLVEDDPGVLKLLRTVLARNGYNVLTANNVDDAIQVCSDESVEIDLLITDVVLPKMSGRLLAEHLLKIRSTLRVVYMSGYTDTAMVNHGMFEPGTAFIEKPIKPNELLEKVRRFLREDCTPA